MYRGEKDLWFLRISSRSPGSGSDSMSGISSWTSYGSITLFLTLPFKLCLGEGSYFLELYFDLFDFLSGSAGVSTFFDFSECFNDGLADAIGVGLFSAGSYLFLRSDLIR